MKRNYSEQVARLGLCDTVARMALCIISDDQKQTKRVA
jgi:hypothetical protein